MDVRIMMLQIPICTLINRSIKIKDKFMRNLGVLYFKVEEGLNYQKKMRAWVQKSLPFYKKN